MHNDYIQRINKVLGYVESHLDENLSLQVISEVAFYSPFHLHRLFKAVTNETLNSYIGRKRLERSAMHLIHAEHLSIAEIAMKHGFNSDSVFSRSFKKMYGLSPSEFRKRNQHNFSKIRQVDSKFGQENFITEEYLRNINHLKNWINMNANIEIRDEKKSHLAYLTQIGEDGINEAFHRIVKWASAKGLLANPDNEICRVFHDSFKVTEANKVRMSIGLRSKDVLKAEGEVSVTQLDPGKCLIGHFVISPDEFEKAWDSLFIWMNEKGHKKADRFPFEVYHNNFEEHPEKKCIVDFYIPIE